MPRFPQCTYSRNEKRYLFTGGGTGGHVYPSLEIADYIRSHEPDAKILFVGTRKGAEERIIPQRNYPLLTLPSQGLPKGQIFKYLSLPFTLCRGVLGAIRILLTYRPHAVLGTGGYASAPILFAGIVLKKLGFLNARIMIHEQNIVPGRLNLVVGRLADVVGVSFRDTLRFFPSTKACLTGYPVRHDIACKNKESLKQQWGIPLTWKILVSFGGSSGARMLNQALWEALPQLLADEELLIYHAVGYKQKNYDPQEEWLSRLPRLSLPGDSLNRYIMKPYFEHIEDYYALADLVLCRAGAGTIWEIAKIGVPAILIPKARLPGDHQTKNARVLERMGRARIIYEKPRCPAGERVTDEVSPEELLGEIRNVLANPHRSHIMEQETIPLDTACVGKTIHELLNGTATKPAVSKGGSSSALRADPAGSLSTTSSQTPVEWMSAARIVQWMEYHWKNHVLIPDDDLRYVHYRADQLLCSKRWQERNIGVKLVGLSRHTARLPLLIEFITCRTPTTLFMRMLGGDYVHVGFIRRNALQALWRINHYDAAVRTAFMSGLQDPYYEVRSWTARAIARMAESVGDDADLESLLRNALRDRWFEVIAESAKALGKISRDPDIFADIAALLEHNNWKVRDAALACLKDLLVRNVLELCPELESCLKRVQVTGLDFSPYFPIRKTLDDFRKAIVERKKLSSTEAHPRAQ